jgi:alginate O-acetyltransferase complex protein AlgI
LFTSLEFYGALIVALGAFYATPGPWRVACLLLISCLFYLAVAPSWFPLLAGETIIAYVVGGALARARTDRERNLLLLAGLVPIVGALGGLKLAGALGGLLMTLGVSYYSFRLISYLLEVYWDENQVALDFVDFAAFVSFAPHMVSGPIQRSYQFLRQVPHLRLGRFDLEQFEAGFFTILRGLVLKLLIGDRLGSFISLVDAAPQSYSRAVLLTVVLCYTLQLYADFAGYTLIAIGIGRLFGIESPPNFNAPFRAANIQEFWRRWHISLSSWVADYVFTPLSLSVRRAGRLGMVASLMLSMILIGLWHGMTGPFLAFGVLQGLYMSVSALSLPARERVLGRIKALAPLRMVFGIVAVYVMMAFSQIFWQAHTMDDAVLYLRLLSGHVANEGLGFADIRTDVADPVFACMAIAFWHGAGAPGFAWVRRHVGHLVPNWVIGGVLLLLISALTLEAGSSFIYGQF